MEITQDRLIRGCKTKDLAEATELRIFDEKIIRITNLNLVPKIRSLILSYNQITEIEGLKYCPDLRDVNLSHNKITSVSSFAFEKNKSVTTLDLSHNIIDKFAPTSAFLKLQELNLEHNWLTTIEFIGNCKELRILNISYNRLKRIDPVDYLIKLEELYASDNQIGDFAERNFKNHLNLSHFDISSNNITSITFIQNLPSLTTFNCSHNRVKKVEFTREMPALENLDLSHNEFPSIAGLAKYAPNLVILDFSSNPNLDGFDIDVLMDLKELREVNFSDNFFVSRGLEDDLHKQFPHLECINERQFQRPGFIELYEIEKMREDPELGSVESEISDVLSQASANDKYDIAEVRKDFEGRSMSTKKFDKIIDNEAEFKAFMDDYKFQMYKLRSQHLSLKKGKEYLTESEEQQEKLNAEIDAEITARETSFQEETKERGSERKKTGPLPRFMTQPDKKIETLTFDRPESQGKIKSETPTKNLLISLRSYRTQRGFKRMEGDSGQGEKEDRLPPMTKTSMGFGNRSEKKPVLGMSEEFMKNLEIEKENFKKIKAKTQTISMKELMQSKNRFKLMEAIQKSKNLKEKAREEGASEEQVE